MTKDSKEVATTPGAPAQGPLRGVRVLDFSQNLPGPYATFVLAALGAEVIKVEPPRGDPGRFAEPFFSMVNRGKRSIALDLRDAASEPVVRALVERADVIVEGFRPGVMDDLGWGFERAREVNPRVIYCSVSAYGQDGPRRREPGHDLNLQALAGVCELEAGLGSEPRGTMLPIADLSTSLCVVASICVALGSREAATHLDVSMVDAVASFAQLWGEGIDMGRDARERLGRGTDGQRLGRRTAGAALRPVAARLLSWIEARKLYAMPHYGVFQAGDGAFLALGVVDEGHFWRALCQELGLGAFARMPLSMRTAAGPLLRRLIAKRLRAATRDRWLERLTRAGVPATPVLRAAEARHDPQLRARGLFDARGWARAPVAGARHLDGVGPRLDEHGAQIRAELGLP